MARSFSEKPSKPTGSRTVKRVAPEPLLPPDTKTVNPAGERIAKVLSRGGIASRRDAERMIEEGRIAINGKVITTPATLVTPSDKVVVDGKPLAPPEPPRLWLYHKPEGLVTTARDELGRPTVFDDLPEEMPRVMTVGRLDLTSEGLLLLTNDGELKRKLELPSTGWLRKYRVRVNGRPMDPDFEPLRQGIVIDGEEFQPMVVVLDRQQGANAWLTVGIREGRNREIRRTMEAIGYSVNRLIRVSYGPFQLGELKVGEIEEVRPRLLRDQLGLEETPAFVGQSKNGLRPRRGDDATSTNPRILKGKSAQMGARSRSDRDEDDRRPKRALSTGPEAAPARDWTRPHKTAEGMKPVGLSRVRPTLGESRTGAPTRSYGSKSISGAHGRGGDDEAPRARSFGAKSPARPPRATEIDAPRGKNFGAKSSAAPRSRFAEDDAPRGRGFGAKPATGPRGRSADDSARPARSFGAKGPRSEGAFDKPERKSDRPASGGGASRLAGLGRGSAREDGDSRVARSPRPTGAAGAGPRAAAPRGAGPKSGGPRPGAGPRGTRGK